jgi:hypothetical protein
LVISIENGIQQNTATKLISPTGSPPALTLLNINDAAPQLDTSMRTLSTNASTETNLSTTTVTFTGMCAIAIVGHSTVGGTSTFTVRKNGTGVDGTVVATGSTAATSATKIAVAFFNVVSGDKLYWNASNSVGVGDTAVYDGGGTGLNSYALIARYVNPSFTTSASANTNLFMRIDNCTQIIIQQVGVSSTATYAIYCQSTGCQLITVASETPTTITLSSADTVYAIIGSGGGAVPAAYGFSFVGSIVNIT